MKFTVFGGGGFIGRNLVEHLRSQGREVFVPTRGATDAVGPELGHVVYAIGLTGDFRSRPFDTVDAHVGFLAHLLRHCRFESWLYLSTTRVYGGLGPAAVAREDSAVPVIPNADSLYDLSKLLGEALCLTQPSATVRIARLSNVYGAGQSRSTFLGSILADIQNGADPCIRESPESAKDYVAVHEVVEILEAIALRGRERIYNVASGTSLTHAKLAACLGELSAASIRFVDGAPRRTFPRIDIGRAAGEFGWQPTPLPANLPDLLTRSQIALRPDMEKST